MASSTSTSITVRLDNVALHLIDSEMVSVFGGRREFLEAAIVFIRAAGPTKVKQALIETNKERSAH